jgi:DUF971 family protein
MIKPVKINLRGDKSLSLQWNDQSETNIPLDKLRRLCPCATCISERNRESKSYIPIFNQSQVTVKSMNSVGSYAIAIKWNDGHDTGIYEYSYLKQLFSQETTK